MNVKDEKKNQGTMIEVTDLTIDEVLRQWIALGGLALAKERTDVMASTIKARAEAKYAEEMDRRKKMDAHFLALGGAPPLDEAEQAAARRKRSARPAPTTDAEILSRAIDYIKARNAKGKPPEGRGLARWTGHDSAKVEALLASHPDVFKGEDKKWHVRCQSGL